MMKKIIDYLTSLFFRPHKSNRYIYLTVFLIIVFPIVLLAFFDYRDMKEHLDSQIFSRRQSIAYLAATNLETRFNYLTDLSVSFATRVQFKKLIKEEKWEEAVQILKDTSINFPYIERVFLADPSGTLMADTPSLPGVKGKNFSQRDWYKGVTETEKSYISEVYKRTAEPQYNVIAVATPIRADDGKMIGILAMQVKLDTIFEWSREIEIGPAGFVYFVDKNGHIAAHPKYPSQAEIVDFSSVPSVQKVLKGERGVEVLFNSVEKEERITAYEPISGYNWGVIVAEPTLTAFADRNRDLRRHLIVNSILIVFTGFLTYIILAFINSIYLYRQKEKVFLDSVGDGLAAIDRFWNITLWNKAASNLAGWSQEEVLGKPLRDFVKFIRERDREENIAFIEKAMLFGKTHFMENNTLLVRKDGKEISVADSASPIFDQSKKVAGAIIIFRDISKEREAEKLREEFSSLATHQLRTPLTAIKGFTSMLLDESMGALNEEQKDSLTQIKHANERMVNLVNALLNASRIELGTLAIEPEPMYLPDAADTVLNEFLPQIEKKKLKLQKNYDKTLPSINADPKLMRAIFQNLLSNAINYTPVGGSINLVIGKQESNALIKVSDTGYGIPKEQQSKIFTKMFRADNITEKQPEGTGLGLYIVKSVVEQSGGKIWFESEENKGTTFYVTIPLAGMKKKEGAKGLT